MTQQRKSRSDRKPIYPYTSLPIENVICVWYNFLRITLHMHLIIHSHWTQKGYFKIGIWISKAIFFIHKDTVFGNVQLLCCIILIFSLERNDHWISHNASEERLRQLFKIDTSVSCYNNKGCSLSTMIHYSSIFIPVIDCIDNNNCKVTTVIS